MANWKKIRLLDVINPLKWWSILDSKLAKRYSAFAEIHVIEQMMYRFLACADCLKAGACKECGCDLPEKMLVFWEEDSLGKWGPVLSKELWEDYKRRNVISFHLEEHPGQGRTEAEKLEDELN